jgi:uncharacterized protein (TIGR02117 family)
MILLLKYLFKYLLIFLAATVAFVLLYLLVAFCLSRITVNAAATSGTEVTVYIKTNGVHTDIVVPVVNADKDWRPEIAYRHTKGNDTTLPYVAFGWGDKGFYLNTPEWKDLRFSTAFNAAFGLSTTAMHTTFYGQLTENNNCRKLVLSREQYRLLVVYIRGSFRNDAAGHVQPIVTNANYGDADAFYEANGTYSLFRTCNTWANSALKACGQRCCLWTAFDTGIFLKYPLKK